MPLCSRVRPDVRDRQTDVRRASSLNAPYLGRGIITSVDGSSIVLGNIKKRKTIFEYASITKSGLYARSNWMKVLFYGFRTKLQNFVDCNHNDQYKNALLVIPEHTTVQEWSCPERIWRSRPLSCCQAWHRLLVMLTLLLFTCNEAMVLICFWSQIATTIVFLEPPIYCDSKRLPAAAVCFGCNPWQVVHTLK